MQTININLGKSSYDIFIKRNILQEVEKYLNLDRKILIVSDNGVPSKYVDLVLEKCKDGITCIIEQGEPSKNIENFQKLCKILLSKNFNRNDAIIAIGGGVVGDLAGFVAASYMRGIDFYNIPTTLLSQVDSSIGGKTAIDFMGIKNIIGAFYQPKCVLIDPNVLDTLDNIQYQSGLAEAIKMAVTFDADLFEDIENNNSKDIIDEIIYKSLLIKANVVEQDEKEKGLRRALNFGHSLGHGIESITGKPHGLCVAKGMLGMCSEDVKNRLLAIYKKEGYDLQIHFDKEEALSAIMHDKKSEKDYINAIYVDKVGEFVNLAIGSEIIMAKLEEIDYEK